MFYFLIILASLFIGLGLVYRDREVKKPDLPQDYKLLERRIADIERLIFDDFLDHELAEGLETTVEASSGHEGQAGDDSYGLDQYMDKYNLIISYEKEGRSIEEICQLLNMQKGEVYLLKNLYKDL